MGEAPRPAGRSLLDDCVHCGFCLPACPTYVSWGEEMDSPRGRIDLMRGVAAGRLPWSPTVSKHFDRCLGCMACVTACPSGVRYDVLIEETRARRETEAPRGLFDRLYREMLFRLLPYPARLRAVAALLRLATRTGLRQIARRTVLGLAPARLRGLDALAPASRLEPAEADPPERTPAAGVARARVALVAGCVQRVFFPGVNAATIRVLAAEGCEVVVPRAQGCCGALSVHAGREAEAREFAKDLITRFGGGEDADAVLVNAAGCGSVLKDYGRLLAKEQAWAGRAAAFAAKVRDVHEFLAGLPPIAPRHPIPLRVAYHDACHLAHAQRVRQEPRALLRSIPGLELVEVPDGDQCCGSAGIYNLVEPESAEEIGRRKAEAVLGTRPDLVASGNPGCTLQIARFLRERSVEVPFAHPVEILDASIRGERPDARGRS